MKYKKGDVFYKENNHNNKLVKIEITDVVYVVSNGTIDNKKYVTDRDIEKALVKGTIYLTDDFYKQKKINEKKKQLEELRKEIEELEKENSNEQN